MVCTKDVVRLRFATIVPDNTYLFSGGRMVFSSRIRLIAVLTIATTLALAVPAVTGPTATGTVGVPYSSGCEYNGGGFVANYALASGSLPGGLTLNPNTCAITGTPITPGTFNFTIQVTYFVEASNVTGDQSLRKTKQSGPSGATVTSSQFTITIGGGVAGAPALSEWVMFGLAGAMALLGGLMLRKKASNTL
jgi:hypothetical protein